MLEWTRKPIEILCRTERTNRIALSDLGIPPLGGTLSTGLILTSDKLPKPFTERLNKALAPYPNINAAFLPPAPVQVALTTAIAFLPSAEAAPNDIRITFRLDDDDVAADFAD